MKYGAVCSPGTAANPSNYYVQADLLYRMRATTARVSMFFESPESRRYDNQGLDTLRGAGLTEMIIQSSETADAGPADRELSLCQGYIDAHPETLFVFELGNEPNQTGEDAATARSRRLTTIRDVKPKYAVRDDGSPGATCCGPSTCPARTTTGRTIHPTLAQVPDLLEERSVPLLGTAATLSVGGPHPVGHSRFDGARVLPHVPMSRLRWA